MNIQQIKQRFGIIGHAVNLERALEVALQVAPTDLSVLITGESGTGKEVFPQIIHQFSHRKHGQYIPVNCGAIPEGTIDSELFGHEKGAFTGAHESRKGYFEVADGGSIFLDEVAELPMSTQVRLLRVLETGEFLKVGSSKVLKTDVRVVAATNIDILEAIQKEKFREDLYYRLNTVPIWVPPLRERGDDIELLFRKFASDFAEKYRMPPVRLSEDAKNILHDYNWPGNIRQLRNITEQISVIEQNREITSEKLKTYIPDYSGIKLPALYKGAGQAEHSFSSEREILYKILFDMRNDMSDLKKLVLEMLQKGTDNLNMHEENAHIIEKLYQEQPLEELPSIPVQQERARREKHKKKEEPHIQDTEEIIEESLSLADKEKELINKALDKHEGKRKLAANDLGISERTLYRKIKEYNLQ